MYFAGMRLPCIVGVLEGGRHRFPEIRTQTLSALIFGDEEMVPVPFGVLISFRQEEWPEAGPEDAPAKPQSARDSAQTWQVEVNNKYVYIYRYKDIYIYRYIPAMS